MFFSLLTLRVPDVTPGCFQIFWLWAYLTLLQDVFQSVDFERTWCYSRMFFNLLTLSVPDVTPGCFSIFWLWAYLTLLQDVFKSFDFERTRSKSTDWKTSWSNVRYAQSQKIEKHPGVTSGRLKLMLLQNIFQYFDFERTWRYSRKFFNLLTLSVPDVTPGCSSERLKNILE
jgi:hypothetical protein